ncbi:MAG: molybdate transport system substrate-binding protein, partial [Nitrospirae bacterium]
NQIREMAGKPGFRSSEACSVKKCHGLARGYLLFLFFPRKEQRFVVFFSGAGMKIPVSEIVKNFTALTGIKVDVHFEGSAILVQHIKAYGDADLFMSGDKKNMDILIKDGFVRESIFIAWHIPSILVPPENRKNIKGLNDLARKGVKFVMSNPAQASLGRVVRNMFQRHPKGNDILNNVVVYGSDSQDDLRLFRDFYKEGRADAVIEWDVMTRVPEGKGLMVIPFEKEYEIKDSLSLALLKTSKKPEIARRFYDYFRTEGIKIFKKHGYNTGVGK